MTQTFIDQEYQKLKSNIPPNIEWLTKGWMIQKALNNERGFKVFHPSAWGVCIRKIAYQFYNEFHKFHVKSESDVDLKMERIFDNGHSMHHRWRSYLEKAGILRGYWKCVNPVCNKIYGEKEPLGIFNPLSTDSKWKCSCGNNKELSYEELPVISKPEYNFLGHVDGVCDIRHTSHAKGGDFDVFIIDMKSMNADDFSALEDPKPEHVIQTQIYMWLLNLKGAVVLYENKNNQAVKEKFVPRNDEVIELIKKQSLWLVETLNAKKLPHRPMGYTRSGSPCIFCEFSKLCFA